MKLILKFTAIVFFLSNTLMAQEDISRPKKIENPQYFGWENYSQFNLNERQVYAEKDFSTIEWKGDNVLLFGSEGFGINQKTEKYVDYFVKIKINKDLESLNISNSASIAFFHISKAKS